MAGLSLPLTEVKEAGIENIDRTVPSSLFPDAIEDGELVGDVEVKGILTKQEEEAAFDGTATGKWKIECTRCLKMTAGAYSGSVEVRAPIDGGPMDITDDVRQAITLAQPLKTLCKPDCKGFCQTCRKNLNDVDCGHTQAGPSQGRIRLIPPEGR